MHILIENKTVTSHNQFKELIPVENQSEYIDELREYVGVRDVLFYNVTFTSVDFVNEVFIDCIFDNCVFNSVGFWECRIEHCKFMHSYEEFCSFSMCRLESVVFDDYSTESSTFSSCNYKAVVYLDAYLEDCMYRNWNREKDFEITYKQCNLTEGLFLKMDFRKAQFLESELYSNSFSNCVMSLSCFNGSNSTPNGAYNYVDLYTLNDSETLSSDVLRRHFGINEPAIKEYIKPMLSEIKFQKVFISYSLQDRDFAKRLSDALLQRGVVNYLFEKHAIAGEGLQHIMHEKQREYDRLLFIASDRSLKSKPCHNELTEAREREKKDWKDIFCPITIDDYIFKVEKHHIKDEESADEFWKNIQSLRKVVVQDFSAFRTNSKPTKDWDLAIDKLVKALKLDG